MDEAWAVKHGKRTHKGWALVVSLTARFHLLPQPPRGAKTTASATHVTRPCMPPITPPRQNPEPLARESSRSCGHHLPSWGIQGGPNDAPGYVAWRKQDVCGLLSVNVRRRAAYGLGVSTGHRAGRQARDGLGERGVCGGGGASADAAAAGEGCFFERRAWFLFVLRFTVRDGEGDSRSFHLLKVSDATR